MTAHHQPPVGIDLGTTYSLVAYLDDSGRPVTIPNDLGDLLTPSAVFVDEDDIIVGREAVKASVIRPAAYAECFKRDMGSVAFRRKLCQHKVPPEVLSALVLDRLKRDAERRLGSIRSAVITVPAYFDELRRRSTQTAGRLAGLEVLDIINEPTAAALAFGYHGGYFDLNASTPLQRILVYDLGGGTFDVTILQIEGRQFRTLATDGDVRLGGKDFDERLVGRLAQHFLDAQGVDPRSDPQDAAQLWLEAQDVKHALSERTKTTAVCSHAGIRMRIEVGREEYEELTSDLLERTEMTASLVLRQSKLTWKQIDRVLLVGGATRMPMVRQMLRDLTGCEPDASQSPDEAVAQGAALYAGTLQSRQLEQKSAGCELVNVNAHSLGVVGINKKTGHKQNVVLIPKNTPLPAHATKTFLTAQPDQRSIRVPVVEGESDRPEDCIALGECMVRDLPAGLPRDTKIEVQYHYSANGRLSVIARVPRVRYSAHVEIERDLAALDEDLDVWRRKLLGQPAQTAYAASGNRVADTTDFADRENLLKRMDGLYTRVGQAALECTVPNSLASCWKTARTAAEELRKARKDLVAAEEASPATLHDAAAFHRVAESSRARSACQQAQVRADFTCLVLGRESLQCDFQPPDVEREWAEIRQLVQQLAQQPGSD